MMSSTVKHLLIASYAQWEESVHLQQSTRELLVPWDTFVLWPLPPSNGRVLQGPTVDLEQG
jgi:hypothetical protein